MSHIVSAGFPPSSDEVEPIPCSLRPSGRPMRWHEFMKLPSCFSRCGTRGPCPSGRSDSHVRTLPPNVQRDEKNRRGLRPFGMAIVVAVLLMQPPCAHAQHGAPPSGPSEKEKAKAQEKRAFEKDTDEAYRSTLSRIPDAKQPKVDPWGGMRSSPQK